MILNSYRLFPFCCMVLNCFRLFPLCCIILNCFRLFPLCWVVLDCFRLFPLCCMLLNCFGLFPLCCMLLNCFRLFALSPLCSPPCFCPTPGESSAYFWRNLFLKVRGQDVINRMFTKTSRPSSPLAATLGRSCIP